jgi:hypothetical protein
MQATARGLSVVSATSCARRRLIRDVSRTTTCAMPSISSDPNVSRSTLKDTRLWCSTALSATLWLPVLLSLDFLGSGRTPDGWRTYWSEFPFHLASIYTVLFVIALGLHLRYRERVLRLCGRSFWLFPLRSLAVATIAYSTIFYFYAVLCQPPSHLTFRDVGMGLIIGPIYWWIGALVTVFVSLIWLTYPMAILNQLLIRKIYGAPNG